MDSCTSWYYSITFIFVWIWISLFSYLNVYISESRHIYFPNVIISIMIRLFCFRFMIGFFFSDVTRKSRRYKSIYSALNLWRVLFSNFLEIWKAKIKIENAVILRLEIWKGVEITKVQTYRIWEMIYTKWYNGGIVFHTMKYYYINV